MPSVHPLVRVGVAAHFQLRNRTWHRTEIYPSRCICRIDPLTADYVRPSIDDSWRLCPEDQWAPCLSKLVRFEESRDGGHRLEVGMRVELDEDAAHLYEEGKPGEWYVEMFGKRDGDPTPIVRLRDKVTEVYVWAPLHWVRPAT